MEKLAVRLGALFAVLLVLAVPALAREPLIPVGQAVGLALSGGGVQVAGFDEDLGGPAQAAGLALGDTIREADGVPVRDAEDLRDLVEGSGSTVTLRVVRGKQERQLLLEPAETPEGKRLGIYVREGITGVGTVTYYDPRSGRFGALGHGVSDGSGGLLPLEEGSLYPAEILAIRKGQAGEPGQLQGTFRSEEPLGQLLRNTQSGVFGTAQDFPGEPIPVAEAGEVHTGKAVIRSDLAGGSPRDYDVEILQISSGARSQGRNLLLKVTDPELLEQTGGIVQGMSGSPILQDGKLVGAVTHVLVNCPARGYGILIENMLEAAG